MRYYVDKDLNDFLEDNVEAVIELIKKAYESTKEFYNGTFIDDFLYFPVNKTFNHGYCFYFARMLKTVYKNAAFAVRDKQYAHISHIFIVINGQAYDVNGKHTLKDYYTLTDKELKIIGLNHNRINEKVYETFKKYFWRYLNSYIRFNEMVIKTSKKCVK